MYKDSFSALVVRVIRKEEDIELPNYQTAGSAGMDIRAAEDVVVKPQNVSIVKTGLHMAIPEGYELQIRSRSGLSSKGVAVLNAPGTIDSDYRGEVGVIIINLGTTDFNIQRGDRIAQGVLAKYSRVEWEVVDTLEETERSSGGFGSTGV